MRKINKLTPLAYFNGDNYKNNCKNWKDFHKNHKKIYEETRLQILIDEQQQQCAYIEIYINNEKESHIDHYIKRDHNPKFTFNWNDLMVATKDNNFGANYKDNSYKIKENEYPLIFNPIVDNVEEYFYYNEFGMIREDEGKVKKTIEVFNLNHEYLQERREKIINLIEDYKKGGLFLNEIKSVLENYGFKSVIEQYCKEEN